MSVPEPSNNQGINSLHAYKEGTVLFIEEPCYEIVIYAEASVKAMCNCRFNPVMSTLMLDAACRSIGFLEQEDVSLMYPVKYSKAVSRKIDKLLTKNVMREFTELYPHHKEVIESSLDKVKLLFAKIKLNSIIRFENYSIVFRGYRLASKIKHSCDPNCVALTKDGVQVIIAINPINKGEELTLSLSHERNNEPYDRRKVYYNSAYLFDCKCKKCKSQL